MKNTLLDNLRAATAELAHIHNIDAALIKARYSGIGDNVHVLLVARRGLEHWAAYERHKSLFDFLHRQVHSNGGLFISRLSMMTEDEYENAGDFEVETTSPVAVE